MQRDNWDKLPQGHKPLLLDRLAYNATLDDLVQAAEHNEPLFEGLNAQFAPAPVRRNMQRVERELDDLDKGDKTAVIDEPEVIAARDVQADYVVTPRKQEAPIKRSKLIFIPEPVGATAEAEEPQYDDGGMEF